mgnify:CR=1 FL=1
MSTNISLKDVEALINSGKLTETDMRVLEAQLTKLEKLKERELCQERFIKFTARVWPTFISGAHHKRMAEAFERVANGKCKRLIIINIFTIWIIDQKIWIQEFFRKQNSYLHLIL